MKQELTTSKIVELEEQDVKRECKGRALAISRDIFRIEKTDSFYCQSENNNNVYYFIRYAPNKLVWCSCPDNSMRGQKCKHIFGVEYAIRLGTLKDIDKLPAEAKRYPHDTIVVTTTTTESYLDDDYDF